MSHTRLLAAMAGAVALAAPVAADPFPQGADCRSGFADHPGPLHWEGVSGEGYVPGTSDPTWTEMDIRHELLSGSEPVRTAIVARSGHNAPTLTLDSGTERLNADIVSIPERISIFATAPETSPLQAELTGTQPQSSALVGLSMAGGQLPVAGTYSNVAQLHLLEAHPELGWQLCDTMEVDVSTEVRARVSLSFSANDAMVDSHDLQFETLSAGESRRFSFYASSTAPFDLYVRSREGGQMAPDPNDASYSPRNPGRAPYTLYIDGAAKQVSVMDELVGSYPPEPSRMAPRQFDAEIMINQSPILAGRYQDVLTLTVESRL